MKKYIYILVLLIATAFYSCKKEATLAEPATFAHVRFNDDAFGVFNNPDGSSALSITYQGKPIALNPDKSLTILAGEGEFGFFNNDTKVLTKKLNINRDTAKTYVFFKPDPDAERVELLENNQLSEPRPATDRVKIKIANFAQAILGNQDVKIVFSQDGAPVDTIQTTGSEFTNGYTEMNCAFSTIRGRKVRKLYSLTFLDKNNNLVLDANGSLVTYDFRVSITNYDLNLYTIIVTVYNNPGQAPQIGIPVLFED